MRYVWAFDLANFVKKVNAKKNGQNAITKRNHQRLGVHNQPTLTSNKSTHFISTFIIKLA